MLQYIIKRLLLSIFTLWVISLIAFGISKLSAGDPVDIILNKGNEEGSLQDRIYLISYKATAQKFGLDKPTFYFSISPKAYPDTLYRIYPQNKRVTLRRWVAQYGNWPNVSTFIQNCEDLENNIQKVSRLHRSDSLIQLRNTYSLLKTRYKKDDTDVLVSKVVRQIKNDSLLKANFFDQGQKINTSYQSIIKNKDKKGLYLPSFNWYGFDNQYHNWLKSMWSGELGISYNEQRPVSKKLNEAIWITIQMNLMAISLAFIIAIPIGIHSARKRGKSFDKYTNLLLFFLYSIPTFWIATMALIFLTTAEYGMDFFPSMGLGNVSRNASGWEQFTTRIEHLILPVLCIAVGSVAFIARQVRGSMQEVLQQDYIRTARAKGLSEGRVIWRHAFRNALFPLITLVANIIPALITGSIVIERIFNIPGMGFVTIEAIFKRDWPVVYAVLMIGAILTVLGILLTDILYALADPRIKFKK